MSDKNNNSSNPDINFHDLLAPSAPDKEPHGTWNLLIADDDEEVHKVTKFALKNYLFEDKGLAFYHAYSVEETKKILHEKNDIAILLLDVAMEEKNAGLRIIEYVRQELNNRILRIILRTGQPGTASEEHVMMKYDINDYLAKTEITEMKFFSSITTSLRSYNDLLLIEEYSKRLEEKVASRTEELEQLNATLEKRIEEGIAEQKKLANEKMQTEEMLVYHQKMASLGEMVAGFSHEINTPLGISVTAASSLSESVKGLKKKFLEGKMKKSEFEHFMDNTVEYSTIILSNIQRASDLVKSMKHIAVDQSSEQTRQFFLKPYIDEIILSLKPKLKRTPHKIYIDCPEALELQTEPGAISQVLTNLIMNSLIHAFDSATAGRITIDVEEKNEMVHISYSDDGKGMPEEVLEHIYDPYFTTKKNEGGSGLGMHLIKEIVTEHLKGTIEVSSQLGSGTTFAIRFPKK